MRSGLDYLDASELVSEDHLVHPRIPVRELTRMLARMMYWGRLNHTPWTKYVPSWCYKKAESYLDNLDGAPARWPALKKLRLDDSAKVMEALFSGVASSPTDYPTSRGQASTWFGLIHFKLVGPSHERPTFRATCQTSPSGQDRRRSVLARKEYSELAPDELTSVETPGRGVMSLRQYGILLKFASGTANAIEQTTGFPEYTPNLSKTAELEVVRARWDPPSFKVL
ncbi:hypothetical protein PR001_g3939 [Phytophthora rubi]|uniref:Uncharacterized protein n=1 Tax=Phytophthora rubi TaxID=129364 RepID=A0A6A3P592_9STRA|nr:hypothetical protein PR001_g3939 [Phytophthora rubi]